MPKHTTDHYDGDSHTRTVTYTDDDGNTRRIIDLDVTDTPLGELGASITRETTFDKDGNSRTTRR